MSKISDDREDLESSSGEILKDLQLSIRCLSLTTCYFVSQVCTFLPGVILFGCDLKTSERSDVSFAPCGQKLTSLRMYYILSRITMTQRWSTAVESWAWKCAFSSLFSTNYNLSSRFSTWFSMGNCGKLSWLCFFDAIETKNYSHSQFTSDDLMEIEYPQAFLPHPYKVVIL